MTTVKTKLTAEQEQIVNSLKQGFITLNKRPMPVSGLIDIEEIKSEAKAKIAWEQELEAKDKAYRALKKLAKEKDLESIQPDLENLGLSVEMYNGYIKIFNPNDEKKYGEILISYDDHAYLPVEKFGRERKIWTGYKVNSLEGDRHFRKEQTFEEFIKSEGFKRSLKYLYERMLDLKAKKS